uniref:hypothetical protein n=1 Tax=Purpureocillium takamizusanense TaxID=2060973 RepID=UPI001FA7D6EB|nr:hypothetical protein MRV25_mgp22 [Purpureocillium takamizusanense]UNI92571.1 hypothetical protein [Purpureocillium takamizusanense]
MNRSLVSFFIKLFTLRNLNRVIGIFIIGILLRYLVNDLNIVKCLTSFSIVLSLCNSIFNYIIEYWLYLKVSNPSLLILHINQPNKTNDYSQYYNVEGYTTISKPSELSNYNIDSNTRKSIRSQLFEEIAQPSKLREVIVPLNNGTGCVYLGIRYCDKPSNTYGLYVKYQNWFNQEYIWNIWEKDSTYLKFSEVRSSINSRVNIWKEIKETTGADLTREVRRLLDTDPFNINKSKK